MDAQEQKYKDGFNSGYFLTQHDPSLAILVIDAAMSSKQPSEYAHGLANGHDTYLAERIIDQNKELSGIKAVNTKNLSPEEKYTKGFNSGYLLAKHEPELSKKLITPQQNPSEYHKGLTAGTKEYNMEKVKDRLKGMSHNNPPPTKDISKNKGRSK